MTHPASLPGEFIEIEKTEPREQPLARFFHARAAFGSLASVGYVGDHFETLALPRHPDRPLPPGLPRSERQLDGYLEMPQINRSPRGACGLAI